MIKYTRKINIIKNNHLLLNQNWRFISNRLEIFHSKHGTNFYEWLDKDLKEKEIRGRWSGFLHNAIIYPQEYPYKYSNKILPLSLLVKDFYFLDKLKDCEKIFVFTEHIKNFLIQETGFKEIESLTHPAPEFLFNKNWNHQSDRVLHIGQHLRKYHSFLEIETKKKKTMLNPFKCERDLLEIKKYSSKSVSLLKNIDLNDYIDFLTNSIVFLDLYDVAACNTIIECIILGVPILVKKLEGCVEYLGQDYPFYFSDLNEADKKIDDKDKIILTHNYLVNMNKEKFKINNFLKRLDLFI
jgi:hypothetical protein